MKVLLAISFLALSLVAAPVAAERLDQILAEMQKAGDALKTLSADFEQTDYDAILEDRDVSRGKLYLEPPGRVRWEHVEPAPKVLVVKDKLVRLYNPTAGQVNEFKTNDGDRSGSFNLLVGFGGGNDEMAKNYDASLLEETSSSVVLKLVPKPDSPASIFAAIELTIDKTTWTPVRSVFHEMNRDHTNIDFDNVVVNGKLPEHIFELDLPEGVEIIKN
ncbi:MAG: outer membrane lipoprotein chaperone LolA [Acidobacteriota bacterium]|nr:MAG: outer membrane lipoprotein chaperone LolA [Acidobacteriota bacterium]